MGKCICLIETLLGMGDVNLHDKNDIINSKQSKTAMRQQGQFQMAIQHSLRSRDSKGRLPLHCAAECSWVTEVHLRLLVKAYIARGVWDNQGFYPIFNQQDEIFLMAIQLMDEADKISK